MNYKNYLFDLDGTLTDPAEGITRAVAHALSCYGICILGPFYGTQVDPDDYVFRWAIPIE